METLPVIAMLAIASGSLSLVCLLALHFVSPEFDPSWRMVSEYALGKHKNVLTLFFLLWGGSNILLCLLLWNIVTSTWATIGIVFVLLSGIGAVMGGLFDVNHKYHGLAFGLGVPTLIVGSLLVAYHLISQQSWQAHSGVILASTHSIWISCVLMAAAMALMFSGFKKAGMAWEKDAPVPEAVPDGVIALGGYANRLLVFCYVFWTILISYIFLSL